MATPVGLIACEAVTNALRHAYEADGGGEIKVRLSRRRVGELRLTVTDDGGGGHGAVPGGGRQDGLGQRLIQTLATQLKGRAVAGACNGGGWRVDVCFPEG